METQYQSIVWNDDFLTGIEAIDKQHKMLVDMLNEGALRLTEDGSRDRLIELVHDLLSYALYHFDTEEELMLKNHYDPEQQALHCREHRNFSAKVAGLQHDLNQGLPVSSEALLQFLIDWLRNHILHTDKRLGQFLIAANASKP